MVFSVQQPVAAPATKTSSGSRLWMIVLAGTLWGTVGITTRSLYQLTATNPLSVGFFRLALATPVLALACWALLGRRALRIARRDVLRMVLIGCMLALYQACYFAAIVWVGVAVATLVTLCLAPVLVALFSVVVLREPLTRRVAVALVCALCGVGCIVGVQSGGVQHADPVRGVALACGSALGYATLAVTSRAIAGRYHALQINAVGFGAGALILLPLALASGFVVSYPVQGWALLAYLGVVPTALGYALFLTGMRTTPATVASILTLMEPLTATVLAWVLFGERLGPLGLIGAALLLGALLLLAARGKPVGD
jgi:DME family drug/metabolite transporter